MLVEAGACGAAPCGCAGPPAGDDGASSLAAGADGGAAADAPAAAGGGAAPPGLSFAGWLPPAAGGAACWPGETAAVAGFESAGLRIAPAGLGFAFGFASGEPTGPTASGMRAPGGSP